MIPIRKVEYGSVKVVQLITIRSIIAEIEV
jgi:hypothetical protein